ncbi:MAG TPA: hypothetical protein VJH33_03065 [Candidatus Paceibacterota bacterium]
MKLSVQECIQFGWDTFAKRPLFFVSLYGSFFVILLAASYVLGANPEATFETRDIVFLVAWTIVGTVLEIMLTNLALKAHENTENLTIHSLFSPMPFAQYILLKIIMGLAIFAGLLLFIVPGVIVSILFVCAPYILIDRAIHPIEALKESIRITRGHWGEFFLLMVTLAVLNIAGVLLFFIGTVVTAPLSAFALVHAYRTLEHRASEVVPSAA